ncbi:MAG: acetyl ornithine aminotransferase family protein [Thermoprotei archaeon]|nr:MAG: acetyl ornithine aminotransferase family protein [Thermoprotei archaeon]RLF01866.1 MAG: acetyl ornithine aminotransferase family protein [Thermoprotei archaeon]
MFCNEYPLIKNPPPGAKAKKILSLDEKYLMQSFRRYYPLVVKRAKGFLVEDVDGNIYIDLNAGIAVASTGHCHPKIVEAIKKRCEELLHYSITDFIYEDTAILAKKLSEITPGDFEKKVFFGNSGAEAVEGSLKVARGYFEGRRPYILAFIGSFHGRTIGALSLTSSKPIQRKNFQPLMPCVEHVPYPYCFRCPWKQRFPECNYWCVDFIEEWYFQKFIPPEEVAAIIFEPIAGEGGYIVPPDGFWQKIRTLADKYGILLIADEVQSGVGRTGKWFAIEHWDTMPDLVLIAKGIASGLPLSAIVGRKDIMSLPPGAHASTFGGNPVCCAAALATIQVIEKERLLENAERVGSFAIKRLNEMKEAYENIGDVRGRGLMIGVEIVTDKASYRPAPKLAHEIIEEAFRRGLLLITSGLSVLRISPPLVITMEAMEKALNILEDIIKNVSRR